MALGTTEFTPSMPVASYDDGSTMTDTSPQLLAGPRDQQHWEAGHGSGACARVRRKLRVEIVLDDDGTVGW